MFLSPYDLFYELLYNCSSSSSSSCCCWRNFYYYLIYTWCRKTYWNKSVDTSDIGYCANFKPSVTSIFVKNCQKWLFHFLQFCVFCLFYLQNDLKIQIWPDSPNMIWGCSIFFILYSFTITLCVPQKSILKLFLNFSVLLFELWMHFLAWNISNHLKMGWQLLQVNFLQILSCSPRLL